MSLRQEPGVTGEKLSAAPDGATLTIVEGPVYDGSNNGWYLRECPIRAYAYAGFLPPVASRQTPVMSSQQPAARDKFATAVLRRAERRGRHGRWRGLSLRQEPSVDAEKLVAVRDGTLLTIVQGPVSDGANNGWYLVTNGTIRASCLCRLPGRKRPAFGR